MLQVSVLTLVYFSWLSGDTALMDLFTGLNNDLESQMNSLNMQTPNNMQMVPHGMQMMQTSMQMGPMGMQHQPNIMQMNQGSMQMRSGEPIKGLEFLVAGVLFGYWLSVG